MPTLKELLKGKLTEKERALVPSSFDIIGDKIVFAYFPDELKKKQRIIGNVMLEHFKHISSIFKKTKEYHGRFRTPKLTWLAGSRSKETLYKENNILLLFDIQDVYFSPRLSTDRKRVYEQVKKNEGVLCLFSGCGVYPIVIAKNTQAKRVVGVELNPVAHKYALENVQRNKVQDRVEVVKGDVQKVLPKIKEKFDRVLMPLPKISADFLSVTLSRVKKNGIVHFYCFGTEDDLKGHKKRIKEECVKKKRKCNVLRSVKCGQFSPRTFRWCIDFKVS